jgi:hypothetical protein
MNFRIGLKNCFIRTTPIIFLGFALFNNKNKQNLHMKEFNLKPKSKIDELIDKYISKCQELVRHGAYYKITSEQENESLNRVVARDESDYSAYRLLYEEYIKLNNLDVSDKKGNLYDKDELTFAKTIICVMSELLDEFVEEADIQITRNLKNKAFTTKMSPLERVDIKEICLGALKSIEPTVFSIHIDTEDVYPDVLDYSKGKFYAINQKYLDYPNKFPLLKEYGVYSDWPNDRVIYKNKDIVVIINEEEHLKFKLNFNKIYSKEKLTTSLFELYEMLDQFEKIVPFAYDDKFGYLSSLPSNTGNSIHFQLKVKLNSDIE